MPCDRRMCRTPADSFFLRRHCHNVWRIRHTARSEFPAVPSRPRSTVLLCGLIYEFRRACLLASTPSLNLMGLDLFVASSRVMTGRPPNFLVVFVGFGGASPCHRAPFLTSASRKIREAGTCLTVSL